MAVEAGAFVGFAAVAFFVEPVPATPLLIVPITVRFVAGAGAAASFVARPVPFLTTVDVLLSLDSLMPLTLRAVLDVAALVVAPVAGFLPLADPPVELATVDVDAVCFRPVAAARVERAFSARLLKRFDELCCFVGEDGPATVFRPGRAMNGLPPGVVRGRVRILDDAGDSTLDALVESAGGGGAPRVRFLGCSSSAGSFSFSLPAPDI